MKIKMICLVLTLPCTTLDAAQARIQKISSHGVNLIPNPKNLFYLPQKTTFVFDKQLSTKKDSTQDLILLALSLKELKKETKEQGIKLVGYDSTKNQITLKTKSRIQSGTHVQIPIYRWDDTGRTVETKMPIELIDFEVL